MSFFYSFYYAPQYSKIEYWGAFYIKLTFVLGYNKMTASAISDVVHVNYCYLLFAIKGFLEFLFLVCFFCSSYWIKQTVYQILSKFQQIIKKKIMVDIGEVLLHDGFPNFESGKY